MFIAHLGVGLAAKPLAPKAPLGVLLASAQALDILCGALMVSGVEQMRVHPGFTVMTPLEFISYPFSHGLFMSIVWSVLAGMLAWRVFRSGKTALVIALLVLSHWVLDWISHAPDLPLLFDASPKVGLGLWNSMIGTLAAEFLIFFGGLALYLRSTHTKDKRGIWLPILFSLVFVGIFLLNQYGPQAPADMPQWQLALPIFLLVLLWPWGNWIDRHRSFEG